MVLPALLFPEGDSTSRCSTWISGCGQNKQTSRGYEASFPECLTLSEGKSQETNYLSFTSFCEHFPTSTNGNPCGTQTKKGSFNSEVYASWSSICSVCLSSSNGLQGCTKFTKALSRFSEQRWDCQPCFFLRGVLHLLVALTPEGESDCMLSSSLRPWW